LIQHTISTTFTSMKMYFNEIYLFQNSPVQPLSLTYKSDIGMHRQVSPSGGRMGGVSGLPPSNTMTSSSISWINNLC
jgi:hypothetical protein